MTIEEYLEFARSRLERVGPEDLEEAMSEGAVVIDIRPASSRENEGEMPGAMVIERNVLEWRLAPSSEHRVIDLEPGQRVIVVCNEGYQSSVAAAALLDVGVEGATDLIGGFRAWRAHRRDSP